MDRMEFPQEGNKWEYDITNNYYWRCWDTSDGVY